MRIMEETGKEAVEINIKSLSLSRVFELDLGKYEEQVNAICHEAKEEAKNEEAIQSIESVWKGMSFEFYEYLKNGILVTNLIKQPEEIKQTLEDNVLLLQNLQGSKYVRAIIKRVQQWDRDLNKIAETVDTWM